MPSLRYQMPPNLFDAAKKNLARADASVSKFNQTAQGVSRIPYATTTTPSTPASPAPDPSAFKFPSIGGPINTSLSSAPPLDSFAQPSIAPASTTSAPPDNSNWRFRSFGQSQLGDTSAPEGAYATSPDAYPTSPDAYRSSPDAYGQVVSSPVVPANWKPRDMSKQQAQYGWGAPAAPPAPAPVVAAQETD